MERRRFNSRAQSRLAWGVFFLAVIQVGTHAWLERRHPETYDPEYRSRLRLLRQRLADEPNQPLLLVVGSSRIATAFRPELLSPLHALGGDPVLAFNFSHTGAGPLLNLMEVRRLLAAGVRPRWLVVELMPPMLNISGRSTAAGNASLRDLPLLARHMPWWKALGVFASTRLVPSTGYFVEAVRQHVPVWLLPPRAGDELPLEPLGGTMFLQARASPDDVRRGIETARSQYFAGLQRFRIAPIADRTTRELLDVCAREGIEVVLVMTPEAREFRAWYAPETQVLVEAYRNELSRTYGVPIVDARDWLADDAFVDAHHTHPLGGEAFTRRFARDVLLPLVAGERDRIETTGLAAR